MSEFENREENFNRSVGGIMASYAVGVLEADSLTKDAAAARALSLIAEENARFETSGSIIGMKDPLRVVVDVPQISIVNINGVEITSAKISMDMTVHASNSTVDKTAAEGSGSAEFSAGWGPFKVAGQMSASASYSKEQARSSDYQARTHAEMEMAQAPVPEGLALIMEGIEATVKTILDINREIIQREAGKQAVDVLPPDGSAPVLPSPDDPPPDLSDAAVVTSVGEAVDETLPEAEDGSAPYTYELDEVPGLSFDAATRKLTGTTTQATLSDSPYAYTATDARGATAQATVTIEPRT